MSFDRPSPDDHRKTVTDSELNEALEDGDLEKDTVDFDKVDHDEGERSPGPQPNDGRHPRRNEGEPIEPPD